MVDQAAYRGNRETILVVCTGNVCRSPYMEYAIRHGLAAQGISHVEVVSAGTQALIGHPMADPILEALAEDGIDGSRFRAQILTRALVEHADVILTAEASHRSEVARLFPPALRRVFTLRQFARLTAIAPPEMPDGRPLRDLVQHVAGLRGTTQPAGGATDDVEDPWNGSRAVYRRALDGMHDPVRTIVASLADLTSRP
ncbi:low molecular weight phosphatase family protein [Cryobacterium cryoconiti]|uniref:Low molecular weight phosphatase family protein n=1 Tax=Cryobacterium cryoconiti TaxID=1259239 RepID=A0A4Y8JVR0_9MICO|nr:low molecular weight phosphatase family protein [Cryobacterium cryoconiti]TFD31734.1 low molecular weight phosphatase family protein [Cryobacterium cryoconiti]